MGFEKFRFSSLDFQNHAFFYSKQLFQFFYLHYFQEFVQFTLLLQGCYYLFHFKIHFLLHHNDFKQLKAALHKLDKFHYFNSKNHHLNHHKHQNFLYSYQKDLQLHLLLLHLCSFLSHSLVIYLDSILIVEQPKLHRFVVDFYLRFVDFLAFHFFKVQLKVKEDAHYF